MKFKKIACIMFLVGSITWGCTQSGEKESSDKQSSKKEQVKPPVQQTQSPQVESTPSGEVDQFGRKPGDPHYGHGHAPGEAHQQPASPANTQEAAPTGEPDSRGRKPGDPHYGHDHD